MMKVLAESVCGRIGVKEFKDTILSKALNRVPALAETGPWIAGGAVRKTLQCARLDSDWDYFFSDAAQAEGFESALVGMNAKLLAKTDKASTFILPSVIPEGTEGKGVYLPEMKIQAIKFRYYQTAEEVIDSFDFTVSQFAFDGTYLYMSDFALWDVARKRLVPHRISYATSSLRRVMKYGRQGFTVCSGALAEILSQVVDDPQIINADTLYVD